MRKIVRFMGFAAHMTLTIPIIALDLLRTIDTWVCLRSVRDVHESFWALCVASFSHIPATITAVWRVYMNDDLEAWYE